MVRNLLLVRMVLFALVTPSVGLAAAGRGRTPDVDNALSGANSFAVDLYARLAQREGNLFFSPHSIHTALAMTYAGAGGQTAQQMAKTLHLDLEPAKLHPAFGALLKQLNTPRNGADGKPDYQLVVANALWGQQGFAFRPDFIDLVKANYGAGLENLDFAESEAARKTINAWVEKQTQEKIKDLIAPGVLDALTRLVLTNAIYFKSAWADQFQKNATANKPFNLSATNKVDVPMMNQVRERTLHLAGEGFDAVDLPYQGNELSMVLLVPRQIDGLAALQKQLSAENLGKWLLSDMKPRKVDLSMPRFKITAQFGLGDTLKAMGMTDAFDSNAADFSGMSTAAKLYITAVIHKAFVDVNEEGTEAAAATAVVMGVRSAPLPQEPVIVKADRPFIFLIRHRATGSILFMGRVTDPRN